MPHHDLRLSDLTPCQRQLVETMRRIRYGTIEHLVVRHGQPELRTGVSRVVRKVKLDVQDHLPPLRSEADTTLKAAVVRLLRQLEAIGDGRVRCLQVTAGLPATMEVEESPDDAGGLTVGAVTSPEFPPDRDFAADIIEQR